MFTLWLALYLFFGAKTTFWIFLVFPSLSLSQHWIRKPMDSPYPNHLSMVCIYLHLLLKSPSSIGEYCIPSMDGIEFSCTAFRDRGIFKRNLGLFNLRTAELHLSGWWFQAETNCHHLVIITARDRNRTSIKPTNQLGMSQNIRKQMAFIMAPAWKKWLSQFSATKWQGSQSCR